MVHLILNTVPTGAKIYRNNIYIGTTPYDESFNDGTYNIRLERADYKSYQHLNWKLEGTVSKTITLEKEEVEVPPKPTELRIRSNPSGARIWLDGKNTGEITSETFEVSPGKHNIILKLEGYDDYSASPSAAAEESTTYTYNLEIIKIIPPPIIPPPVVEETWWEKLLGLLTSSPFLGLLTSEPLFKSGYLLLTGEEISDTEYELKKLRLADWVLPINLLLKLFEGRNLKGEAEEFGSASDWIEASIYLVGAIIPGQVDETAAKFGLKAITKTQADELVTKMGSKAVIDGLKRTVKANPETSAKFLSKFPVAVRNAVIAGLGRTAYGREAIYILGKTGYFKYTAPGLKGILAKVGTGPKWFLTLVGAAAGYLTFANFLAWIGKEALVETLSFPIWALIDSKDYQGVLDHVGALKESIDLADKAMFLTKPIPLISDIWKGYIDNANAQADIYEKIATDALAEEIKTGELTVFSNVENSDVYIDGIKVGTTPFTKVLEEGVYHILVTKFGYDSTELDVDIVPGATPKFNAEILPLKEPPTGKGTLDISVEPTDAVLVIAGHPEITKMGAYELDLGSYTIKASKENYYDKSATGIVKEAEITDVSIVLTKKEIPLPPEEVLGTLTISVTPEDALIEVAGQEEITTAGIYTLSPGSYAVRASKEDYETSIKTAIVSEEKDTAVSFTLAEITPPKPVTTKATITITSEPTLADVYIDGEYAFTKTPYTVLLAEGSYFVRVQKEGYYPTEVEIEVEAGEVAELPLVLTEIPVEVTPPAPYYPQTPYYPTYEPAEPYVPSYIPTPTEEIAPYNYSNLYPPVFSIAEPEPYSKPLEKELLINIETTDLKPWEGRIYSIGIQDLSEPGAEPLILINNDERLLIEEFLSIFETINPAKLVGFKLIFDYRYIFAKMMLYRITNKKFYNVALRDVKQILDQVKEEFVYYPDKKGTLDDWGKMLLGRGKYGAQELMLRKYISGDFEYVQNFQIRQIELTRDLYNLARYSMGEAFIPQSSPVSVPISTQETANPTETPGIPGSKTCPVCKAYNPLSASVCEICGTAI